MSPPIALTVAAIRGRTHPAGNHHSADEGMPSSFCPPAPGHRRGDEKKGRAPFREALGN
jgi:hypothetical protein